MTGNVIVSAESMYFDLRYALSLMQFHNTTVSGTQETFHVERTLRNLCERIEDVATFVRSVEKAGEPAPEEGVGEVRFR